MDLLMTMYLVLGFIMFFALLIVLIKIAGKDIFFAFYRFFTLKGCDIFIINPSNNHVDQHYKIAKEEHFLIDKEIYLTNPYKLQGLSPEMCKTVAEKMSLGTRRIKKLIEKCTEKRALIKKQLDMIKDAPENLLTIQNLTVQLNEYDTMLDTLNSRLEKRQQHYYRIRRPVYFYIKGDPIPKDFYEVYSQMDCIQLENIISRAQTKDPKSLDKLNKDVAFIKMIVLFLLIGVGVAIFFGFRCTQILDAMAQKTGTVITL